MVDHYQVLGVTKNATKKEVKDAFRRLAIKYHPDKHAQSPDHVRRNATVRFKLVSEAYEVLNDDLKRASYNAGSDSDCFRRTSGSYSNPYGNRGGRAYGYGYGYSTRNRQASSFSSGFDSTFRYLTTRAFLLNLALAGGLYLAFSAIDTSGETLWKMRNSGLITLSIYFQKSFEEAMESIEKSKSHKDEG
ncbi:chaperone protein dnaJ 72 isoform X1 [Arabidopsis lyrata subsp. lyrata]|uniref:chaperone protein dnaJ 72 isoform X1 n=1 Tax=Arabidopsis lyrata subsp. lyrata TaxID=81972 RepID=UPI000A29CB5D|nr:chaperone protein dnaJ 72 isoform X1 [Arabidopsis lyrata subsp. lyrata]XP_020884345.1 chaperone protein dnaJ 72 isoform X1 [Arabidopsis lyrata subsp. lyrata]|eukprot:XP_020884344.1 chaperone protein dnaJ 72 isoform X1 [Arabidopsis lyrata subsp. lyrata]